jgi:hypothetical protein
VNGVSGAGLITTALPAARAGASFHTAIISGAFHGVISPQTPTGTRAVWCSTPGIDSGVATPLIFVHQPA